MSALRVCLRSWPHPCHNERKMRSSACSIDPSSTASLCTSIVPECRIEQQTRTVAHWPWIPDPPTSQNGITPPSSHWPSHNTPCSLMRMSHVGFRPSAQVRLLCADCFKGFCIHQQKSGGGNFLEFSLGLPLYHFVHSWLALSLNLSSEKRLILKGVSSSWKIKVRRRSSRCNVL